MGSAEILTIVSIIVTWILGVVAKRVSWFNNYLIPVQNILIGVIFMIIEFCITKDLNAALALSGLVAGGTYDMFHNLTKILEELKEKFTSTTSSNE